MDHSTKQISILGCGWYGLALAQKLTQIGYSVKGSTTTPEKLATLRELNISPYLINFQENEEISDPSFFSSPVLVICIPPRRKSTEQAAFISKIRRIADAATLGNTTQIIFISSTSVYGDHYADVNEHTLPQPDTESGKAILVAEALLRQNQNIETTIIRFGGLIGPGRVPGRFFAGKSDIPNGRAPVNLIHLTDCLGITLRILELSAFGFTYNACSPEHPAKADFYRLAALRSGFEVPEFKDELLSWKKVNSIMISEKLNYSFQGKPDLIAVQ